MGTNAEKPAVRMTLRRAFRGLCRRSPNLPHTYACSTIGPTRLNFRVRDGNGWDPRGKLTGKLLKDAPQRDRSQLNRLSSNIPKRTSYISITTKLVLNDSRTMKTLRRVNSMDKPNGRLVLVSYTHCCASTSSLSTRWSSWALHFPYGLGDLILERASRLYAFSGYHNRTSLPSRAIGMTTGTQEVRPSRSSRTKDSPLQISYAHSR
jgi:hypothetical protein